MIYFLSFIVLLSFIVFFHEYGHFKVARMCGVKVDVFSIGFGPVLFRRTDKHGTEWRISALPLGGFVKFFGDAGPASSPTHEVAEEIEVEHKHQNVPGGMTQFPKGEEKEALEGVLTDEEKAVCYHFKPVWQRMAIVAAGPIANFILAIVVFAGLMMAYERVYFSTEISKVIEGTPAAEAGFQPGDVIKSVNGRRIDDWSELTQRIRLSSGDALTFEVDRGGVTVELIATPAREEVRDAFGNVVKAGALGLQSTGDYTTSRILNPLVALKEATFEVGGMLSATFQYLSRLILGKEDLSQLGGPFKIAKYAGQSVQTGFGENVPEQMSIWEKLSISLRSFLYLAAAISVSVGFLNLLPIPVLDGGHLVFYSYEAIAGKPLSEKVQSVSFTIGIVVLVSLMVFVTWNDVTQEFFSKATGS